MPSRAELRARKAEHLPMVALIGDRESTIQINRKGLLPQRIAVPKATHHLLTERQRKVLKNRVRMGNAWVRMLKEMSETGMTMEEYVQGLSIEELVKGRFKDKEGGFRGRPPKWVPREFHRACVKELMRRGGEMWQKNYLAAIEAMTEIAAGRGRAGQHATPGERIKAAQFVIERMEGKVPERIIVTDEKRWETVMDGIVAEVSPEAIERGRQALNGAHNAMDIIELDEDDYDVEDEVVPPPLPPGRSSRRGRK
jgi:hypothetical protein